MSSRSALPSRAAEPANERARAPAASVQSAARVEAAASGARRGSRFSFWRDPLFGMAIASVVLFAILAALMALG